MNVKVKKCLLAVVMVLGMVVSYGGNNVEAAEKVDINSASVEELQKLEGVGAPLAQKIIDARPYKTVDELKSKVTGIGDAKLQAIKDQGLAVAESFPEKIDLNKASLYDLQFLVGVGAPLAQKIIDARPYQSVDELKDKVVGIGQAKLQDIKNQGLAMVSEEKMIKEWFPDGNLAKGVAESMSKNVEDIVSTEELAEVTQVRGSDISRLDGAQYLVNVSFLSISGGEIQDLSALANMKNLKRLSLTNCGLKNLDDLNGVTSIEEIYVQNNELTNLNGLKNCKNLKRLEAWNNKLVDIDVVSNFSKLGVLFVSQNEIDSIEPVANLSNLDIFYFNGNHVPSIEFYENENKIFVIVGSGQTIRLPKQTIKKRESLVIDNKMKGYSGKLLTPFKNSSLSSPYPNFTYAEPKVIWSNLSESGELMYNFDVNHGRNPDEITGYKDFSGKVIIPVEVTQ
ncbi:hypothetical protein IGI39_000535 [Enterococcus sp. AZ135]|uniref:helix-hairpin-helix domain-containing protein n=1 Tax=unclassified Enterococcus TaxID=2608891 RepID=UPI003F1F3C83